MVIIISTKSTNRNSTLTFFCYGWSYCLHSIITVLFKDFIPVIFFFPFIFNGSFFNGSFLSVYNLSVYLFSQEHSIWTHPLFLFSKHFKRAIFSIFIQISSFYFLLIHSNQVLLKLHRNFVCQDHKWFPCCLSSVLSFTFIPTHGGQNKGSLKTSTS